ncbi:hypothetical protein ABZ252_25720 [Streptomyces sp. NPDC006175]|uniref:hypothetical protein n=1 Tax=unclassified Streptomyces TaxID=2593676 RepID=UPI0033A975D1
MTSMSTSRSGHTSLLTCGFRLAEAHCQLVQELGTTGGAEQLDVDPCREVPVAGIEGVWTRRATQAQEDVFANGLSAQLPNSAPRAAAGSDREHPQDGLNRGHVLDAESETIFVEPGLMDAEHSTPVLGAGTAECAQDQGLQERLLYAGVRDETCIGVRTVKTLACVGESFSAELRGCRGCAVESVASSEGHIHRVLLSTPAPVASDPAPAQCITIREEV